MIGLKNSNPFPSKEKLSEIQQYVLDIAEDLIVKEKKTDLYPLELLNVAKEKSNYSESELFYNITQLYEMKWIVPGEEQLKDHVLDTLKHREILSFIYKNPGCDTPAIMRALNVTFRYALKNLETLFIFGFIRARKYSQYFLYFPYDMPEEEDMLFCVSRNKITRQILTFLAKQKLPVNCYEIAHAINRKEITIQRKLIRLVQFKIVELVHVGMRSKYRLKNFDPVSFKAILERYGEK